jgi:hypothetical protein
MGKGRNHNCSLGRRVIAESICRLVATVGLGVCLFGCHPLHYWSFVNKRRESLLLSGINSVDSTLSSVRSVPLEMKRIGTGIDWLDSATVFDARGREPSANRATFQSSSPT